MNRINSLSDELLAAFIDGNTTPEEESIIRIAMSNDDLLDEVVDAAKDSIDFEERIDQWQGDYGLSELGLPETLHDEDLNDHRGSIFGDTYGYEPNYDLDTFDPNIYQNYSNTCAIRSQQIVLRDYGIMISQDELIEYAKENHCFNDGTIEGGGGTKKHDVGMLLEACGIKTTLKEGCNIFDIVSELRSGHRVIVGVDAGELWVKKENSLFSRLLQESINRFNDIFGSQGGNHALIVAGVDVNPKDPSDLHVTLIDSGTGDVCISYKFQDFLAAWEDSNCFMISTNTPAPFQYNHESHIMEPSGFMSDFDPAAIKLPDGLTNNFKLYNDFNTLYSESECRYSEKSPIDFESLEDGTYQQSDDSEIHSEALFDEHVSMSVESETNEISSEGISDGVAYEHPDNDEGIDESLFSEYSSYDSDNIDNDN